jgi:hypothetical protein
VSLGVWSFFGVWTIIVRREDGMLDMEEADQFWKPLSHMVCIGNPFFDGCWKIVTYESSTRVVKEAK